MSRLNVCLEYIQHVKSLTLDLDLNVPGLMCLVGRNGAGKTTLVRALRNLSNADTFVKTATPYAFGPISRITYEIDDQKVVFSYDQKIRSLNCRDPIPPDLRNLISAELPMPYGARFNYFKNSSDADLPIRRAIAHGNPVRPGELVAFINAIYGTTRFSTLVEVTSNGKKYYAVERDDGTYIREDYLSSGEYFLISLFRTLNGAAKLIVIDEIDISLDSVAQANLASWLRKFCTEYQRKILFTTHSLALMKQLEPSELFYVNEREGHVTISPTSYGEAKSRLFGFHGWDKYILTEDVVLLGFIEALIEKFCSESFYRFKTIFIGGARQVYTLMLHNADEEFLASADKVIAILDGDQINEKYAQHPRVNLIPIASVEKALLKECETDEHFPFKMERKWDSFSGPKDLNNYLIQKKIATQKQIYDYLIDRNEVALQNIVSVLREFLLNKN